MSMIKTEKLCKDFGDLKVLKDCSLTIEQGEFVCLRFGELFIRQRNSSIEKTDIFIVEAVKLHRVCQSIDPAG